jgi:hypothetical protein
LSRDRAAFGGAFHLDQEIGAAAQRALDEERCDAGGERQRRRGAAHAVGTLHHQLPSDRPSHNWLEGQPMGTDTPAEDAVRGLNQRTFEAEDHPSRARDILEPILSSDFCIVRSSGVVQDKQRMIEQTETNTSGRRRDLETADVHIYGDAAVVRTRLTLREQTGKEVGDYENTKVFVRQDGGWQCVSWQVTEVKPQ